MKDFFGYFFIVGQEVCLVDRKGSSILMNKRYVTAVDNEGRPSIGPVRGGKGRVSQRPDRLIIAPHSI